LKAAALETAEMGLGPVAQAVADRSYEAVVLLSNYPEQKGSQYHSWLKGKAQTQISLHHVPLTGPTQFGEIYQAAVKVLMDVLKKHGSSVELTFHLSPGTPAMAAVWIILAKTRFPAELIESSKEHGVRTAAVPFEISAEFIPDLLRKPDRERERLSASLPPEAPEFVHIIHRSAVMKRVIARARRVATRSVPVLIEGESGTGKELLARAIHNASPRRDRLFVAVNCGAIPSELIESELFGHVKGAFTGADRPRQGYFEAASEGTLFLDEVGELPLQAQVKILRTLQEGEVVPVGATKPTKINVRVIAATNRTLTKEIATGAFRADLFYRLAVAILQIPPLRERPGDLSLLIDRLLDQINQESAADPGFVHKKISVGARNLLLAHHWPGNVRELLNTLRRAAIWSDGPTITVEDARDALLPAALPRASEILNRPLGAGLNLPELMASVARHYLSRAMEESHGNKTKAAESIGLPSYQTLANWLRKYGLDS
jgi:transcriptional regulator with PAS, ATPase and Fis domain